MRLFSCIAILLCAFLPLSAQKHFDAWGTISEADLNMTIYAQDSLAPAVILHDIGDIRVLTDSKREWVVDHTRIRRIKIFDVAALKEGNLLIPYRADRSAEKISELSVQVFLPNGEVQKVKSDNVFTERLTKHWMAKKIFIPNLQKGCVIEYRYTLTSEYIFSLYDWYFQDDVPIRWSEVRVSIPEYFAYVMLLKVKGELELTEGGRQYTDMGRDGRDFISVESRYGKGNIPAIKTEPFITTLDDYREQVSFQLSRVTFPGNPIERIMTTWEDLAKRMEEDKNMGEQYRKSGNSKDLWEKFSPLMDKTDTPEILMEKVRAFVAANIKWNESYRVYTDHDLDKSFELKNGSTSDINLAVVALLRKAGLDAVPVLVSTTDNGKVETNYPIARQFNSVVACVRDGEKRIFLDATDPFLPVGQVRLKQYNKEGWVLDRKKPEWVKMKPAEVLLTWLGNLRLSPEGVLSGKFEILVSGTIAAQWRNDLKQLTTTAFLKKNFDTGFPDIAFDSIVVKDGDVLDRPLKIEFVIAVPEAVNIVNDYMYFKPVLAYAISENPFKSPLRQLPVTLPHPIKASYILNLELPEGYQLEETPKPERINLPGDIGRIAFNTGVDERSSRLIHVNLRTVLTETEFAPENYTPLKTFFNLMFEKTDMQLVFKKPE